MRACKKYWLIAVSSLNSALLRWPMIFAFPFIARSPSRAAPRGRAAKRHDYSAHDRNARKRKSHAFRACSHDRCARRARYSGCCGDQRQVERAGARDRVVEDLAGQVFAVAATIRTAGAMAHFGERTHAALGGYADRAVGDGVADADVHADIRGRDAAI